MAVELSYCVVNTNGRELLLRCLDAIAVDSARFPHETEVLVLDNASEDGSAEAARAHPVVTEVIALEERTGKGENDSELLRRARGRYALLLNEDAELIPGATATLHHELETWTGAGAAGARLVRPDGVRQASAWRFPGVRTALASALNLHRLLVVQSTTTKTRQVDWVQSAAMLVRTKAAEEVGYLDPDFFVYSDEVDFCKRLRDARWATLYVPGAVAIHHEQLSTGAVPERRIVEFSRNRDLYLRKHHTAAEATVVKWLTAWTYAVRALVAVALPGHDPRRYRRHASATLHPERGEGLREAAAAFNAERRARGAAAPAASEDPPAPPDAGTP